MVIRKGVLNDAPAIAGVHVDSWRTTYKGMIDEEYLAGLSYSEKEETWQYILSQKRPEACTFVAENEAGDIVGFASGGLSRSTPPVYGGELYAIYLLEEYQNKGYGKKLIHTVARHLLDNDITSMEVWVAAENPAKDVYKHLGAVPYDEKVEKRGQTELKEIGLVFRDLKSID